MRLMRVVYILIKQFHEILVRVLYIYDAFLRLVTLFITFSTNGKT